MKEEIEIGLGLISDYRGMHLGHLIEKELSENLLKMYPQFDYIVARIDNYNLVSIGSILKAGFEYYKDDEYHFKK